jgi:hypothetical protein
MNCSSQCAPRRERGTVAAQKLAARRRARKASARGGVGRTKPIDIQKQLRDSVNYR